MFGPVVNLASRLESLTRQLGVSIVLDEAAAAFVREHCSPTEARVRRLCVRPKGMDTPVTVSELLPPATGGGLSDEQLANYESGLEAVIAGRWDEASRILKPLVERDTPAGFLQRVMTETGFKPPTAWDGAFTLKAK